MENQELVLAKRIVISGYYGFGNTGDEAVLAGMLASFRKLNLDVNVTVLSANPQRTENEHPGVKASHRYKIVEVVRAIRRADVVISGGGSLLQDVTSSMSARYYLFVIRVAGFFGRKTMIYAQGVGPLIRKSTRRAVQRTLNGVDLITVRDPDSKALLESIGVNRVPIHLSADPSFFVEPDLDAADRLLADHGLCGQELIGVSIRQWPGSVEWVNEMAKGLREVSMALNVPLVLIPMQEPADAEVSEALGVGSVIRGITYVRTAKGLIARCRMVVGMRLHSLIFAASAGVPFIAIEYDPKVASFTSAVDQGRGVRVDSLKADDLMEAMMACWESRESLAERVGEAASGIERARAAIEPTAEPASGTIEIKAESYT